MLNKCSNLFKKNEINPKDIIYIKRDGRNNALHLIDGRVIPTYIPAKTVAAESSDDVNMLNVNKGVYLSENYIVSVEKGIYTMSDGATFKGRVRTPGEHKLNAERIKNSPREKSRLTYERIRQKFSCVDDLPVAFCVIELKFDEAGHGVDFIFRYCNKQMEVIEGKTIEEMTDRSFYEVFTNGDKRWLVVYADVALNGGQREMHCYSREVDKNLYIKCFQPEEGFCGCVLLEE